MPTRYEDVPADVFLEYKGVKIYYTYKNDDVENIIRTYSFVLNEFDLEMNSFDVRDIKGWRNWSINSNVPVEKHVKSFLKYCIDNNLNFSEGYTYV